MNALQKPLTPQEIAKLTEQSRLHQQRIRARVQVSLEELMTNRGIDGFHQLIEDKMVGTTAIAHEPTYRVVGFKPQGADSVDGGGAVLLECEARVTVLPE